MAQAPQSDKPKAMGFAGLESMTTQESELLPNPVAACPTPSPLRPSGSVLEPTSNPSTSTISSISVQPTATESPQTSRNSGHSSSGWIWAVVIGAIVIFGIAVNSSRTEIKTSSDPVPQPAQAVAAPSRLVVAALTANIREKPSAQSRLIKSLKRGERIEFVDIVGTFTQVKLADKTLAFVASELVIPEAHYLRLNGLSPQQYLDARKAEQRVESLLEQISPHKDSLVEVLFRITNRDALVSEKLKIIKAMRTVRIEADESAGIWYSLTARTAANLRQFDEAALNARAAIEADPVNPDYHVSFALSKYALGQVEPVKTVAQALTILAPRATNTWMLYGLALAMDESEVKSDDLATGSFILAIKLSRSPDVTRKYFKDLMTKSDNPRVQQLLRNAMVEETATPAIYGF